MIYADKIHKNYQALEPKLNEEKENYARIKELKGKQEGLVAGEAKGIDKRNIEIAEKMLAKKRPIEEILEFTGLTVKYIYDIKGEVDYFMGVAKNILADDLDISNTFSVTCLTPVAMRPVRNTESPSGTQTPQSRVTQTRKK